MKKIQVTFTTDPKTKKGAELVAQKLGMSLSTAVNMFLNQMIYQKGLPFTAKIPTNKPNINRKKF